MWFRDKKEVAPLYKDETQRRLFAIVSDRPPVPDRLKEMELASSKDWTGWRRWLSEAWKRRPN